MTNLEPNNLTENFSDSKFNNELDFGLLIYIVKRSLWIVLLLFIISLGLAFVYLRYSQTIYQASSVIQINLWNMRSLSLIEFNNGASKIALITFVPDDILAI